MPLQIMPTYGGGGLGTTQPRQPSYTLREIPSWCDYVPFSSMTNACQPYSRTELEQQARSDAEYAAYSSSAPPMTDEERLAYIEQHVAASGDYQQRLETSDAQDNPQGLCQYNASQEHTLMSQLFGTGVYCNADGSTSNFGSYGTYTLLALAGIVTVLVLKR